MPKIVSLSPSTQAAAGLTPNRATIKDIEAALLRAPNFLASLGLSDEADLADLLKIPLGSGHYAYAFALPNGTVLKVTDDEDDARVCKMILEQGNGKPGLPFIQSVHRLPGTVYEHETDENEERPIFAIVMESVTPASRAFRGIRPRLLGEVVLYPSMEPELPSDEARAFVRQIRKGIHWLARYGVAVIDLHHNNFGYASGKRPVIIDFGHGSLRDDFEMTPVKMAANPSVSVESRAQAFKRLRASNNRCAAALKRIDTKLGVGDIMKALDLAESEEQFRQILDEYRSRMAKISPENAARREQIIREWEDTIDESIDRAEEVEEEPLRDIWRSLGSPRVDMNELRKGIKVEQEHTGDLREAGKVAMDHLREFPDYYTRLTKMEARAKAGLEPNPGELTVRLSPRQLDFYDGAQFEEFGVEIVSGGVRGTREALLQLAGFYEDDADPKSSGIEPSRRRNAHEAAARIREALAERMEPNGRPSMPHVRAIFDECFDMLTEQFPDFGELELHQDEKAGGDNGSGSERQFGYCMDGKPIRVAFARKTEDLPVANIRGLMAHEFGHALDYRYGDKLGKMLGQRLPAGVERRADSIAKAVFGKTIKYDDRNIQCVACQGKNARPRRLGP